MTTKCPSCHKLLGKHSVVDLVNCGINILNYTSSQSNASVNNLSSSYRKEDKKFVIKKESI